MSGKEDKGGNPGVRVILITFPDRETARQIGTLLVESQLAACVNIVPELESIYRWEGKVNRDAEVMGIVKTREDCVDRVRQRVLEHHPYEVPEFLVLRPESGLEAYLNWVGESCRPG